MTLVGLGLLSLPMLLAVGVATLKLDDLTRESRDLTDTITASTRQTQRIRLAIQNMERYGRQLLVFRGTDAAASPLDLFHTALANFNESVAALEAQGVSAEFGDQFAALRNKVIEVTAIVESSVDLPTDADIGPINQAVIDSTNALRDTTAAINNGIGAILTLRLDALEENTRATQNALVWQAAALIPGMLLLVGFFVLFVGRPMRQIDRAIRELGEGHFGRPIAVTGPGDIETLARQLEWLRLRLAESTEEKNRFLRHMSHELKTPLANIREGTELLLDGSVGALERQQHEVTGILRDNGIKLQRLIENLLTFSAWQANTASLEISQFELKPLVFGILSQHRLIITNRGLKLRIEVAPVTIQADEGKVRLVLENLISNAIKFTPDDGEISVRAETAEDALVLQVSDSGPGVATQDRERIFEAFYQGRRQPRGSIGGTGIGLSVVNECVIAHGGTIELLPPERGKGAHFVVRLPLRHAAQKPRLVASA